MEFNEELYNQYFSRTPEAKPVIAPNEKKIKDSVYVNKAAKRLYQREISSGKEYDLGTIRRMADDSIDDIEQLADILKRLCNAAWGEGWGEFSPDLKKGEQTDKLILPQITCEVNTREIDENIGTFKPKLTDIIMEEDGEGNQTGDAFLVYRQWFDYNVEFDIYGRNSKEARMLCKRFENLLAVYAGYLKRHGISEIWFEQETHPKCSLNYDESAYMRSIYYYIRFEAITPIRQSTINRINTEIGVGALNTEKVKFILEQSEIDTLDLDFFDGDNGVTFKEN